MKHVFCFLLGISVALGQLSWQQLGADIKGTGEGKFGSALSLSANGKVIAIPEMEIGEDPSTQVAKVHIYYLNNSEWTQRGSTLEMESGVSSVSLNFDGTTVAVYVRSTPQPALRIYRWIGESWQQLGFDILDVPWIQSNMARVSLSDDGSTVAVGFEKRGGAGSVRVSRWDGIEWNTLGGDIEGATEANRTQSLSLNSDGTILAVGDESNDESRGQVRVYRWNGSQWQKRGPSINGEAEGDRSGRSVSLSSDGSTVAIGAYYNEEGGLRAGHIRVYEWIGGRWQQKGLDIDGKRRNEYLGWTVSLSSDGSTLATMGSLFNDGTQRGGIKIYTWADDQWSQVGSDIFGAEFRLFGQPSLVSLSADGLTVAGGIYNERPGFVRVYASPVVPPMDTDKDGLTDDEEINTFLTDPFIADTDGDGLNDGEEVQIHSTNPLKADTNEDGFRDGLAVEFGLNPLTDLGAFRTELLEQLKDLRINSEIASVTGSEAKLQLVIEESEDLTNWTKRETIDVTIPVEEDEKTKFLRFKLKE
ncbi:hypothetical protein N8496_00745 [Akkermansiaceae bacterium]|nr:hypothetical protein [Akkermansiaceae bacterium]